MTLTRNAIGNLINRYKAVLQKCNLMNTFGSLAVAAMLVMGGAGVAAAAATWGADQEVVVSDTETVTTNQRAGTLSFNSSGATLEITGATVDVVTTGGKAGTFNFDVSVSNANILTIINGALNAVSIATSASGGDKTLNLNGGRLSAGSIDIFYDTKIVTAGGKNIISGESVMVGTVTLEDGDLVLNSTGANELMNIESVTAAANKTGSISATSKGSIAINGVEMAPDSTGKVTLNATGNIDFISASDIKGGKGDVSLTAGNFIAVNDITGGTGDVTLTADGKISARDITTGAADSQIKIDGSAVNVRNVTLKDGDLVLNSTDGWDMKIGKVSADADTTGSISASSKGSIVVADDVEMDSNSTGNVTLNAAERIELHDGVSSLKNIKGGQGDVSLTAGGEILANDITTGAAGSQIKIDGGEVAVGAVALNDGDLVLNSTTGGVDVSGYVTAGAGATGGLTIKSAATVALQYVDMSAGTGDLAITAAGDVTLNNDFYGGGAVSIITKGDIIDDGNGFGIEGGGDVTLSAKTIDMNHINIAGAGHITADKLKLEYYLNMGNGGDLTVTGTGSTVYQLTLTGVKANVSELEVTSDSLDAAQMSHMVEGSWFGSLKIHPYAITTIDNGSEVAIGEFTPGIITNIGSGAGDKTIVGIQNIKSAGGTANTLDKQLNVLDGAVLGYGNTSMQALKDVVAAAAASGAPVDKGVYVAAKTLDVGAHSVGWLLVGDSAVMSGGGSGDVNFGEGATLAVDQKALGSDPVFGGTTSVEFTDGSNIVVANATDADLKIADNVALSDPADVVTVFNDSDMLTSKFDPASGVVSSTVKDAAAVFPDIESGNAGDINELYARGLNDVDSPVGGIQFLSRATNKDYLGADKAAAARTIEGASRVVATSAPQMAAAASNAGVGAVMARTSIGNLNSSLMAMDSTGSMTGSETGLSAGDSNKVGLGLWIMPLWQSINSWGMKAGEFKSDMHGNIGGVAIGADYTFENAFRAGITFNIGGGYAEGSGDFARTTNNMNFWGIGLYGSWAHDNFGVTADVNYTSTFNKIKQELDSRMGMADLKSDVYSSAITAGLRGEYKFVTDALDITPHLGVRLMYLHTDEYDVKSGGMKVHKGDDINQTIWSFPVGVTLSKAIHMDNGWYVKPSLDLQVTPRAGEVMAKNDIKYTGLNTSASIETQTMDYISYGGAAGIEFGNDNLKLGLNYNLEAGAHTTNHGVFATFRYEF